jgi:UbiD family decarboxylase
MDLREHPIVGHDVPISDLRDFLQRIEAGEVVHIDGVESKHEMGAIAEVVNHKRSNAPAVLFDRVPGYPAGYRVLSGQMNSAKRLVIALGFPEPRTPDRSCADVSQSNERAPAHSIKSRPKRSGARWTKVTLPADDVVSSIR